GDSRVIDEVQHGNGDDESQVEPIRYVNVRLLPLRQRAEKNGQVDDPHHGEPKVRIPFWFRILFALRNTQQVAGAGDQHEQLVAPDDEPRGPASRQSGAAGALHDIKRSRNQYVATEGKNHRRGVQRSQAPETGPGQIKVQRRKSKLPGYDIAHDKTDNAPNQPGDGGNFDGSIHVARRKPPHRIKGEFDDTPQGGKRGHQQQQAMKSQTGAVGGKEPCRPKAGADKATHQGHAVGAGGTPVHAVLGHIRFSPVRERARYGGVAAWLL